MQAFDLDVWPYVDNGLTDNEFDEQAKEETLRGFSKLNLEKVICCETTKEIWNELQSIYDIVIQAACDVKSLSLKNGAVKDSKSSEDHEWEVDSSISRVA